MKKIAIKKKLQLSKQTIIRLTNFKNLVAGHLKTSRQGCHSDDTCPTGIGCPGSTTTEPTW